MVELKTTPNEGSVIEFLEGVVNEKKKKDNFRILEMMGKIAGEEPVM